MSMDERLEVLVSGRVQMVMFRDFVQRKATNLKLRGEVENLPDGTVRVIAEGTHERLEKLLGKLHRGSLLAKVEKVKPQWALATNEYHSFTINYGR